MASLIDRFNALGINRRFADTEEAEDLYRLKTIDDLPNIDTSETYKESIVGRRGDLADLYYLLGNFDRASTVAISVVETGRDYFLGDWRSNHPNPDVHASSGNWIRGYAHTAIWGLYLAEYGTVEAVSRRINPGFIDYGCDVKNQWELWRLLAYLIGQSDKVESQITLAAQHRNKYTRLTSQAVRAIYDQEQPAASKAVGAIIKHFRHYLFDRESPWFFLDRASSILTAYAAHIGMPLDLPDDLRLYLVERPADYLIES